MSTQSTKANNYTKKVQASNEKAIKKEPATVKSVDDDYAYATVTLNNDKGTTIRLPNKTGDKLGVGEFVWVFYTTKINCGWIGLRNGKPNPLVSILNLDSAAVIPTTKDEPYLEDTEVVNVDIKNQIKVAYGSERNRVIIGGYLMPVMFDEFLAIVSSIAEYIADSGEWGTYKENTIYDRCNVTINGGFYNINKPITYLRDLSSKEKSFFEDNLNCVYSQLTLGSYTYSSYIKSVALTKGDDDYGVRVNKNNCSFGNLNDETRILYRIGATGGHSGGDSIISDIYTSKRPHIVGLMPVVFQYLGGSTIYTWVSIYNVAFDLNGKLIGISNTPTIESNSTKSDDGLYHFNYSFQAVQQTLTDEETNYFWNIQSRSEVKPSDTISTIEDVANTTATTNN